LQATQNDEKNFISRGLQSNKWGTQGLQLKTS